MDLGGGATYGKVGQQMNTFYDMRVSLRCQAYKIIIFVCNLFTYLLYIASLHGTPCHNLISF